MAQPIIRPPVKVEPEQPKSKLMSTADAIRLLGVSAATFETLRKRKDFPKPFRFSSKGKLSWSEAELWTWIEAQRLAGGPESAA